MDIQQGEKKSPAAYVHRFKTEAKRCGFTNGAATIRIFIKGFKMPIVWQHKSLRKGPQTLIDAILKVEKLNAAQQQ